MCPLSCILHNVSFIFFWLKRETTFDQQYTQYCNKHCIKYSAVYAVKLLLSTVFAVKLLLSTVYAVKLLLSTSYAVKLLLSTD